MRWRDNPRIATPGEYFDFVRLWARCRGGMGGFAIMPDPGGVNDQAAWVLEAFGICERADAALTKHGRA